MSEMNEEDVHKLVDPLLRELKEIKNELTSSGTNFEIRISRFENQIENLARTVTELSQALNSSTGMITNVALLSAKSNSNLERIERLEQKVSNGLSERVALLTDDVIDLKEWKNKKEDQLSNVDGKAKSAEKSFWGTAFLLVCAIVAKMFGVAI